MGSVDGYEALPPKLIPPRPAFAQDTTEVDGKWMQEHTALFDKARSFGSSVFTDYLETNK